MIQLTIEQAPEQDTVLVVKKYPADGGEYLTLHSIARGYDKDELGNWLDYIPEDRLERVSGALHAYPVLLVEGAIQLSITNTYYSSYVHYRPLLIPKKNVLAFKDYFVSTGGRLAKKKMIDLGICCMTPMHRLEWVPKIEGVSMSYRYRRELSLENLIRDTSPHNNSRLGTEIIKKELANDSNFN